MFEVLKGYYHRHFTDPEAVVLALFLLVSFLFLFFFGEMLASVFAALVIAFILEWLVNKLEGLHMRRGYAIAIVYFGFLSILAFTVFFLLPLLWQQIIHLIEEMPGMISHWQQQLLLLPVYYPELISEQQINDFIDTMRPQMVHYGQRVLSYSGTLVPLFAGVVVYFVLLPLMIFFMLKDRDLITHWVLSFLPRDRRLIENVWDEVYGQFGNYVRGKVAEVLIVGIVSWILLAFMGLNYAGLIASIIGVSVLVPYVGPIVATIPLAVVAYFQWGWGMNFFYVVVGYGVLQALDGNVLVPILFSEVVNLHPLAIIIAVIFFGALWGVWGVFFSIPLAILIKAVINAWP